MDFGFSRENKLISHSSNLLKNLKRAKILGREFVVKLSMQGILSIRLEFNINTIPHFKYAATSSLISLGIHLLLSKVWMVFKMVYGSLCE